MKTLKLFFTLLIFSSLLYPQDKPNWKLSGLVFGDYFYKVAGIDSLGSLQGEFSKTKKDFQAFTLRRAMFIYEHSISEKFTATFSLEGGASFLDGSGRYSIVVKTAFLTWNEIFKGSNLIVGYQPAPAWSGGLAEKLWNYRSVEKTISDFRGLSNAVDLGIGLKGKFDKDGNYGYFLLIGNGTGLKPESNKYKRFYASIFFKPLKGLTLETFADYEPNDDDKSKITMKGIAAYQTEKFTIGVEAVHQNQKNYGANNTNIVPFGISVYAWGNLISDKKNPTQNILNAFARFDYYDPNKQIDSVGFRENFITAGLDYKPYKDVHFMPNIWITTYKDKSSANTERKADVVARMTFFYVYK